MEKLIVNDISVLTGKMMERAKSGETVCAILFYNEARHLASSILNAGKVAIQAIEIEPPEYDNYEKEYYVFLDEELRLSIEPAWHKPNEYNDGGYYQFYADTIFIDGDAKASILQFREGCSQMYELSFTPNYNTRGNTEKVKVNSLWDVIDSEIDKLIDFASKSLCYCPSTKDIDDDDEVLRFIRRRFPNASEYFDGNCYYFALILKDRFPEGEILYDVIDGHFVFLLDGEYYDNSGIANVDDGYLVSWDDFGNYDSIQEQRIIRDCLM